MTHKSIGGQIASFPGLPHFYLIWHLHNTQECKTSKNRERPGSIIRSMMSGGHKLDAREGSNCQNNTLDHLFECSTQRCRKMFLIREAGWPA